MRWSLSPDEPHVALMIQFLSSLSPHWVLFCLRVQDLLVPYLKFCIALDITSSGTVGQHSRSKACVVSPNFCIIPQLWYRRRMCET